MRVAAVVTACVLGVAAPAAASEVPRAEAFGGYSYARSEDQGLHGWGAAFGYNFTRQIELEAELSMHYGGLDGTDFSRLSLLAGPRFNFRAGRVTPFVRALAGVARSSSGITVQNVNISARDTGFAGAAGGGVDFTLSRHLGLRLQGDYFMVSTDGEMVGDPRAAIGITYRIGQLAPPGNVASR